jgi:hypothetical protein
LTFLIKMKEYRNIQWNLPFDELKISNKTCKDWKQKDAKNKRTK